ncbi:hypothetical protein [Bradyrhizobium pachyrhizi]|uniref:hypothetical protein n=1 Tax=Bradyrhizobium pachyrhizi TaxID=280333 RepID=UPI003D35C721
MAGDLTAACSTDIEAVWWNSKPRERRTIMPNTHDHNIQPLVDQIHVWAESLLKDGGCPSCLAKAMIAEGFHLANHVGAVPHAKEYAQEIADRYADGKMPRPLSPH